jgi:hypothetical protein
MSEFIGNAAEATQNPTVGTHKADGSKLDVNKNSVSKKLAKVMPSRTPLDSMLRNTGTGTCKSDKYEFFSLISRGVKAVVSSTTGVNESSAVDTVATITLSSGVHCLSKDCDLLVPSYTVSNGKAQSAGKGKVALRPLVIHITDIKNSANEIKVIGVNAPVPQFESGVTLYRMANAADQDIAMSEDPQSVPVKDHNYCQRNLCTISENAYQALQEKEVEFSMAEMKEQALYDFRWQAEVAAIFGADATLGENFRDSETGKRKLHMRGLVDFPIHTVDFTDELYKDMDIAEKLNIACEEVFAGNNGSEERLFIYGPEVATMMANSAVWQKRMDAAKTDVKWGVKWKLIETNFGTLRGVMQPGFGLLGDYNRCAVVVDPANIRRIEQVPLTSRNLDLRAAGRRNSNDVVLEEATTLEVTNPKTHAFLIF